MEKQYKIPFWVGLIAFSLCIRWILIVSMVLPQDIGLYGTAIIEVGLLVLALVPVLICRVPLREVFPIRKPSWNHIVSIPILYFASTCILSVLMTLTGFLFPEKMAEVYEYIAEASNSVPVWASFLITAFMAPLCEEPFHRGLLQYSMGRIRRPAWKIVIIGAMFGAFHLEPFRFVPLAAMGMLIAYIMHETDNLLIPVLFHFFNNALSSLSGFLSPESTVFDPSAFSASTLGITLCIYGVAAPFVLYGGVRLLTFKNCRSSGKPFPKKKYFIIAAVVAAVCFLAGAALVILGMDDLLQNMNSALQNL